MAKLWASGGAVSASAVDAYTASADAVLDNQLVEMDVWTNAAHVRMLAARGYMNTGERDAVLGELSAILAAWRRGEFVVVPEDEDVHTKIENTVTGRIGEAGQRIHTGRSRNDQVLTDMRLYCKAGLYGLAEAVHATAAAFLDFAGKHALVPMPGYTHMQRAMPSSVGLWAGAFAESLGDDLRLIAGVLETVDASPLGSGACTGISLNIDREATRALLGFSRLQSNAIYCHNSRGKLEGAVLAALSAVMLTLGRFASDLLLYTTAEYAFFTVASGLTTGSSIMPQKKNLDPLELLRARVRTVLAAEALVKAIPASLPSGYSRDLQETKRPLLESFQTVLSSLEICRLYLDGLSPDHERLAGAMGAELYATDDVFALVREGVPFREAYRRVKDALAGVAARDPHFTLDPGATPGTPANPDLETLAGRLAEQGGRFAAAHREWRERLGALLVPDGD